MTVLVVDDDDLFRNLICRMMRDLGFSVLQADNGVSALEIIQSNSVNLLLSDVKMPKGSGIDLLKNMQALKGPRPFVIMMSGFSDLTLEYAKELGAMSLIAKPFQLKTLVALIEESLRIAR